MKLLVIGGSGLLGNAILEKSNFSFDVLSTYNNNKIGIPNTQSHHISLPSDFDKLRSLLNDRRPDVVINTAAYSNVDFCESNKEEAYLLNTKIAGEIASICSQVNSKLIFISSDYVFDGTKGNYSEDDKPSPMNYYGHTKKLAEELILKSSRNTVIRTSIIYGLDKRVRFLNFVVNNLKKGEEVLAYNDIFQSPILIDEIVESILKVAISDMTGIFHVSGSSCVNKFDFAKIIAEHFGFDENLVKPISVKNAHTKGLKPGKLCLDNTKAKKTFNINFSTIEEGVRMISNKSSND